MTNFSLLGWYRRFDLRNAPGRVTAGRSQAQTGGGRKWIKFPVKCNAFSPHSSCNGTNSPPSLLTPLSLSSPPPPLLPVLPSAFTFCSPPVWEQILSSLHMTLQSVLQQKEGSSVGIFVLFHFFWVGKNMYIFIYMFIFTSIVSLFARGSWQTHTWPAST